MARLPTSGGDDGTWGDILNEFLLVLHNSDGTIKDDSITTSKIADGQVTAAKVAADVATQAELNAETAARNSSATGFLRLTMPANGGEYLWFTMVGSRTSTMSYFIKDRLTVGGSTDVQFSTFTVTNEGSQSLFCDWVGVYFFPDTYPASQVYALSINVASTTIAPQNNFDLNNLSEVSSAPGWAWNPATRTVTMPAGAWTITLEVAVKPVN